MTEVFMFKFNYVPHDKKFPIQRVELYIMAENIEAAKKIAEEKCWTFFNQDCDREVSKFLTGYINE